MVFVFEDEPSMDHFRSLFQASKFYLDEDFNFLDLQYIGQSKENNIEFLKYIFGIDNFLDKKSVVSFLNKSNYIDIINKPDLKEVENIWILKNEKDNLDI